MVSPTISAAIASGTSPVTYPRASSAAALASAPQVSVARRPILSARTPPISWEKTEPAPFTASTAPVSVSGRCLALLR